MFRSTHPRGVRLGFISGWRDDARVSIHAPAWGATLGDQILPVTEQVSIHAPAWGATRSMQGWLVVAAEVSIHAPAWGATTKSGSTSASTPMFRSTHPRGVRPARRGQQARHVGFRSTHPRGVRLSNSATMERSNISFDPRTRVGCDYRTANPLQARVSFDPRTRVGCDDAFKSAPDAGQVSIHAPAWGATRPNRQRLQLPKGFRSTHPRGVRQLQSKLLKNKGK